MIEAGPYGLGLEDAGLGRGHSSVGRAVALQASGRRFDPVWLHHSYSVVIRHLAVEDLRDQFRRPVLGWRLAD